MILWLDAQISPLLAPWIASEFKIEAHAVREFSLQRAKDIDIFKAARIAGAVIMTKDSDFLTLLERLAPPPQILWITCGNTSNERLKKILSLRFPAALALLASGEPLIEISE